MQFKNKIFSRLAFAKRYNCNKTTLKANKAKRFYSINQRNIFGKRYLFTIEYLGQNMSLKLENGREMFRRISYSPLLS